MRSRASLLALAAGAASGALLWLSSPHGGLGWLAWVALVPSAAAALSVGGRTARAAVPLAYGVFLALSFAFALPFGIAEDQWGDPVLPIMVGDSPVVAAVLVGAPLAALALYAIRFPQPLPRLRAPFALVLVPAAVWTALDVLRTKYDPSGLWGPLFLSQHDLPTRSLASLAGPWGVTFAIVGVNFALALVVLRRPRSLAVATGAVAAVAALFVVAAALRVPPDGSRLTVAAVQPGYDTAEWDEPPARHFHPARRDDERASLDVIADLAELSEEAVRAGAELVVWPEAVAWVPPRENAAVRSALTELAGELDVPLVVPYFRLELRKNAVVAVTPGGEVTRPQPKQRPMWFLGEEPREEPTRAVATGLVPVGVLLGVDNQDAAAARALALRGARLLASATHDWEELAIQQRAFSRVHAAALGLAVVRADWRYGSGIYDHRGGRAAEVGVARERGTLTATVATGAAATPYARIGDVFGWACVAAAGLLLAAGAARARFRSSRRR